MTKKTPALHGNTEPLAKALTEANRPAARAILPPGKFGRMFPADLPANNLPDQVLIDLGNSMRESAPLASDSPIPAGYTYFGQFVDHDLSFTKEGGIIGAVTDPTQQRSPELELDSLYGKGPSNAESRAMYEGPVSAARFKIGMTTPTGDVGPNPLPNDLLRQPDQTALIPDPRNDENLLVAQTHLLFMKFHNKVLAMLPSILPEHDVAQPGESPFKRTQRIVTWHYQWIVWNDFVRRLIRPGVFASIANNGPLFYKPPRGQRPFMPVEFSVAAYRLGHSMVRDNYSHNRVFFDTSLDLLFAFTGGGGMFGSPTLPSNWIIDWRRFYNLGASGVPLNFARKLDTKIGNSLFTLPGIPAGDAGNPDLAKLAVRNLLRGKIQKLPSGQQIANFMGAVILQPNEINSGIAAVDADTPLWYYILREAEVLGEGGNHLGPVGSRIVGEVFMGLLQGDADSYLRRRPTWRPFLGTVFGVFEMADLVRFVNDINPIG